MTSIPFNHARAAFRPPIEWCHVRAHVGARRERWSRGHRAEILAEYRARRLAGHTAISSLRSAREVQRRREDVSVLAWLLVTYGADARGFRECSAEHDRRAAHLLLGELPGADLVEVVWDWRAERGIPVIGQVLGPRCWVEGCTRPRRFMQPPARSAWCQKHFNLKNPFGGRASDTAPVVTVVVPDRGQSADAVMDEAIAIATRDRPPTHGYRNLGAARPPSTPFDARVGEEQRSWREADSWIVNVADLPGHVSVTGVDENASLIRYVDLPFEPASQRELDDLARGYGLFRDPGETDDDLRERVRDLLAPPGSRPGLRGLVRDTVVRDEVDPRGSR